MTQETIRAISDIRRMIHEEAVHQPGRGVDPYVKLKTVDAIFSAYISRDRVEEARGDAEKNVQAPSEQMVLLFKELREKYGRRPISEAKEVFILTAADLDELEARFLMKEGKEPSGNAERGGGGAIPPLPVENPEKFTTGNSHPQAQPPIGQVDEKQIEVITYEQDRLNFFTDLMQKAQKKYKRLFNKYKDNSYLSEEAQILSDAGRETHFFGDVVEMLEKGYRKQEWISVDERLPDEQGHFLIVDKEGQMNTAFYTPRFGWCSHFRIKNITHWMPLPEAPKMKGGAE